MPFILAFLVVMGLSGIRTIWTMIWGTVSWVVLAMIFALIDANMWPPEDRFAPLTAVWCVWGLIRFILFLKHIFFEW